MKKSQNPDGGWGYKAGGMSYVEPTSAVLLALELDATVAEEVTRGRQYLTEIQHEDGGWGIAAIDEESGWMTAWATLALRNSHPTVAGKGADWLIRTEGLRVTNPEEVRSISSLLHIDATLTGWPWQAGDASWIFPTALALLALEPLENKRHPRVQEGINFLTDRAVHSGGWNVGNPFMVTGELPGTIITTALVLITLEGLGISNDITRSSLEWMVRQLAGAGSSADLAWGLWACRKAGIDSASLLLRLVALRRKDGSWMSNPFVTSIALMALTAGDPGAG